MAKISQSDEPLSSQPSGGSASAAAARPATRKEEIISQIRQYEELRRDSVAVYDSNASAPPIAGARSAPQRGWRMHARGAGTQEMAQWSRQLATLIDVGIPLLRALEILGQRSANPRLATVSRDLGRRVEEGQPLSVAMSAHPHIFPDSYVGVVRAGEAGGILEESMRRVADLLERRTALRRKVIAALIYPAVALVVEAVVIFIIVFWAMPKLLSAYPRPEMLPPVTRNLLSFTHWVAASWWILLLILVLLVVGFFVMLRTVKGRYVWNSTTLRMPITGRLSRKINVARFSRTVGSLTAAGIPLIDALGIAAETADNAVVERTLYRVRDNVERGGKMDEPMRQEPIFDPIVVDMVTVGDEAGAIDTMLLKIADTYDEEVEATLRGITGLLEPLLIVLMGITVAFIALAVFVPYFKLVNNPNISGSIGPQ